MSQIPKSPSPADTTVSAVISWWSSLYPGQNHRGDASARASIRRAGSPFEVMLQPATHVMYEKVRAKTGANLNDHSARRLALAAAALCELRTTERSRLAFTRALGPNSKDEPALLSQLRFQNLMAAMNRDDDDALVALRRAMIMIKDTPINVHGLVRDILTYDDQTRIRWTFDYFKTDRAIDQDTSGNDSSDQDPSAASTLSLLMEPAE